VLFIDAAHEGSSRWQDFIDEDKDSLLRGELYAFANHIDELANGEIGGNEVLLLVDGSNIRLLDLLADDGDAVTVLLSDPLGFSLALLKGMLVLEL